MEGFLLACKICISARTINHPRLLITDRSLSVASEWTFLPHLLGILHALWAFMIQGY